MADDRSLDEFLGGGSDDDTEAEDQPDDGVDESDGDEGAPEPARSTTAFDPDGAPCEACGETVRRRWRDDDALVCGACKAW